MRDNNGRNLIYPFSLGALGLVDSPPETSFDNLTQLATAIFDVPVALVSIVEFENDRQYFKSQQGLPEPWATRRQTPLSHSFCQHVVKNNSALAVNNSREHRLVCNNGAVSDLNVIAYLGVPIYDPSNRPVGALCVIDGATRTWQASDVATLEQLAICVNDAIGLRAAVKTSEALRSEQETFTYAISHDLKAPTNTLQLLLEELSQVLGSEIDEEALELLQLGGRTIERMGRQVEEVLAYTRMIGAEVDREPVNLESLMADILGDLKGDIEASRAKFALDSLPMVPGSKMQLRALFQNLISNALKFRRPDVDPLVTIRAAEVGGFTNVSVKDNGIGIPVEEHKNVFKMFRRLHVRNEYPGTGLGLSLCHRIAANHGGQILVDSEQNRGSEFTVRLPAGSLN